MSRRGRHTAAHTIALRSTYKLLHVRPVYLGFWFEVSCFRQASRESYYSYTINGFLWSTPPTALSSTTPRLPPYTLSHPQGKGETLPARHPIPLPPLTLPLPAHSASPPLAPSLAGAFTSGHRGVVRIGVSTDVPRFVANVDVICTNIRGKCHDMTLTFAEHNSRKCHDMT